MTRAGSAMRFMLPSAVSMAMPFLTLPIMTRWLTPTDYGIVAIGQVVAAVFAGLAALGVATGVERYYWEAENDPRRIGALIFTSFAIVGVGTLVLSAGFIAFGEHISAMLTGSPGLAPLLLAQCWTAALAALGAIQNVYFRNTGQSSDFMWANLGAVLLESAFAVIGVVVFHLGVWGLVGGALVAKVAVVGLWSVRIARAVPASVDVHAGRSVLSVGAPFTPRVFVGTIDGGVDRVLLGWLNSLGQAGVYSLGNRVGSAIFALMTSLEQVFLPPVYRMMFDGGEEALRTIGRHIMPYFYVTIAASVVVMLFIEEVLWLLVTPAFWGIRDIAVVLTAYYGQMFFGKIAGAQLIFTKRTLYATPIALVRLALHIVFALLLIGPFGALGVAFALLLTGGLVDLIAVWVAQRRIRIRYHTAHISALLAILYASMTWMLAVEALGVSYPVHLVVRLGLLGVLAFAGRQWFPRFKQELRALLAPALAAAKI